MPVSVQLSDDQSHLIYELQDPMKIDDLMEAYDIEKKVRDSIPYTLHSIVDMTQVRRIPRNWLTAKAGPGLTHPRSGYMMIVGISSGLKTIVGIIFKITKYNRIQFFETRDEAETYMTDITQNTQNNALA